ncbi:MAG: peptidyl-prolyl cis-trans isomerase [Verrucomicrobiales bacterium]|nr:peptidyl-prolyl cis-trans isomerase [Verrucomicrobiales bacterium]
MLTQIRHIQKGTLIVVTILIVIAFAFLYSDFDFVQGTVGGQDCVVKVYDRCYRQKEAAILSNHYDVAMRLGMYDFATVLFGEDRRDDDRTNFIMSLVILRKEAERMGIEPTAAEIKAAIPTLPVFQQPWVNADIVKNNILGPNGFTDGDLAQLVKDYLSFQQLRELIGSGVAAVPSETERLYTKRNQRYHASLVNFDRSKYTEALKITEEEVKEYFEENSEELMSLPKRAFDYAHFIPNKLPDEATAEAKANATRTFANAVNRAYADLAEDDSNFVEVAKRYEGKKADFEMKSGKYEPFAEEDASEDLKGNAELLKEIFSEVLQLDDVTIPISDGDGGYFVFHYAELVEPRPLTLDEARNAIQIALKAKKSNRIVSDAASEARAKLVEAIAGGKNFAEAAKDAGVEVEALPPFSAQEPPADRTDASLIISAAQEVSEKEVSSVVSLPDGKGYMLVYVDKIDIYEDENEDATKRSITASTEDSIKRSLFTAWFNQRRQESGAVRDLLRSGPQQGGQPVPVSEEEAPTEDPS